MAGAGRGSAWLPPGSPSPWLLPSHLSVSLSIAWVHVPFCYRQYLICGVLLAAIGLFVTELWQLYLLFSLIGCLGAGANALPYLRTLSTWFDKRRGLAIGLAMGGSGFGYAYVPPMLQYLNTEMGWRTGYFVLAAITVFVALPLVYLFLYDANKQANHQKTELTPDKKSQLDFSLTKILSGKTVMAVIYYLCFIVVQLIWLTCPFGAHAHRQRDAWH